MEFQSFLNRTKKIIEVKCFFVFDFLLIIFILFWGDFTFFIKRRFVSFIHMFLSLCSNTLTLESIFEFIRQKLIKNMLILKFYPWMKCLHVIFSFSHPGMKSHPCLSSRDEISSQQKRVNSKRHFTIDRDDFIPGWNFTCKHPLRIILIWN